MNRRRLGLALAIVGAVLAVFGLYRLGEAKPITAGDGRLAQLLLEFVDPMTATLAESYAAMMVGALLAGVGLYMVFSEKP
jgi:hypothetical protein